MSEVTFLQRLVSRLVLVYFFLCILILLFLHKFTGTESLRIDVNDFEPFIVTYSNKRTHYSTVIAFVTDCEAVDEQIAISCYVIHVRLSETERFDTGVLYTFWKTNWSRLLTPQALYAARDNSDSANTGSSDVNHWQPACFVCLNSVSNGDLRVFLPCRHAGLCADCFTSFIVKAYNPTNPLNRLLCCPLCRTPISSVLCLPSN
ncbi:uncharacterized protein DEA37_0012090 [Paragonimus westermani]|uniref:RING-type domain-containing protein n=1 Tax=Paragonimus westermani TaxID=34504 RepID=A0A5J4NFL6_9TREM|nr:uncharacterized protein DEA37_0012090 [Paragonimus westermani]